MKKYSMIIKVAIFMAIVSISFSQTKLPSISVKDLNNKIIDTKTFSNEGKPFVISFWATWCKPCLQEMSAYNELYDEWQKATGVKIFAISIDDSRNSKKVAPFIKGKNWKLDVYLDENSEFKRAMNVNNPPQTFLFNGNGGLVWQHVGYTEGDEEELIAQIKKLVPDSK